MNTGMKIFINALCVIFVIAMPALLITAIINHYHNRDLSRFLNNIAIMDFAPFMFGFFWLLLANPRITDIGLKLARFLRTNPGLFYARAIIPPIVFLAILYLYVEATK
jgi:hypothetical protein